MEFRYGLIAIDTNATVFLITYMIFAVELNVWKMIIYLLCREKPFIISKTHIECTRVENGSVITWNWYFQLGANSSWYVLFNTTLYCTPSYVIKIYGLVNPLSNAIVSQMNCIWTFSVMHFNINLFVNIFFDFIIYFTILLFFYFAMRLGFLIYFLRSHYLITKAFSN